MNKKQKEEYYYAKGIFVGIIFQNILLVFFLIMISSKDVFEFFGLIIIWYIVITFSLASIIYFSKHLIHKRGKQ